MRLTRIALGALAVSSTLLANPAHAAPLQLELGAFGGWHYFSSTNQLGRDVGSTDDNMLKQNTGTFGLRLGFIVHPLVDLEAELGLTPASASSATLGDATAMALNYRAHVLVHFLKGRVRPFALIGGGGNTISSSNPAVIHEDTDGELHAGIGLKVDIQKNWGIRLDGRVYTVPSVTRNKIYATADGEILLGFYGLFGGAKEAAPKPAPVAATDPDRDGDGIPNDRDLCPDEKGIAENRGCPDRDTDRDGIVDRLDKCPKEPGSSDNGGCPERDGDGDGIVDRLDKCPAAAGPAENNGCPETDTDGDGIVDRLDKCPTEPETKNGYKDGDGCPDELPKQLKKYAGAVKGINFANGKATLLPSSNRTLDEIVKVLTEYQDTKVEIQGHTDNVGDRSKNIDLSKARAEAVRAYLVAHGIAEARITAVGYGPDQPVADNKTAAGKSKNRRVEFKLVN